MINRSKSRQVMSMGMFIISSVLILASVLMDYHETGKMNWVLLFALLALNGIGIVRTVRFYRTKKSEENRTEDKP